MSDIFREVDEEVRREQLKALWDKWGNVALALSIVVVLGIAGWRGWEWWQTRKAAEAGAAFEAALTLAEAGKNDEAAAAFDKVAADAPAGYRLLARFREATALAARDNAAAIKAYDELAADSGIDPVLREIAQVRAGLLLVDTAPLDEMRRRLEPLAAAERSFRHTARELLALTAWRTGDATTARRWLDVMANDAETPPGTRARVEVLLAIAGDAGKG